MLDHQGPMIDNAPSFAPFFNTSFDSLGDPSKLAMSMSGGLGISPSFSFGLGVSSGQAVNADDGGRSGPYPMPNNSLRLSFGPSHSFGDQHPIPVDADASKAMILGEDQNAGACGHFGPDFIHKVIPLGRLTRRMLVAIVRHRQPTPARQ